MVMETSIETKRVVELVKAEESSKLVVDEPEKPANFDNWNNISYRRPMKFKLWITLEKYFL